MAILLVRVKAPQVGKEDCCYVDFDHVRSTNSLLGNVQQLAWDLLPGASQIQATYRDDEGDKCTLTEQTAKDALCFTTLHDTDQDTRVLEVEVYSESPVPSKAAPDTKQTVGISSFDAPVEAPADAWPAPESATANADKEELVNATEGHTTEETVTAAPDVEDHPPQAEGLAGAGACEEVTMSAASPKHAHVEQSAYPPLVTRVFQRDSAKLKQQLVEQQLQRTDSPTAVQEEALEVAMSQPLDFPAQAQSINDRVKQTSDTIPELVAEVGRLRAAAEDENTAAKARSEELQVLCAAEAEKSQRLESELESLRAASDGGTAAVRAKIDELEILNAAQEDSIEGLRAQHSSAVEEVQRLEGEATKSSEQIKELQEELDRLRATAAARDCKVDELEELRMAELTEHSEEISRLEAEAWWSSKVHKEQLEALRSAAEDAAASVNATEAEHAGEISRLEAAAARAGEIQEELEALRSTAEDEGHSAKTARDELETLGAMHADDAAKAHAMISQLKADSQSLRVELKRLWAEAGEMQEELEALRATAEDEAASAKATCEELKTLRAAHADEAAKAERLEVELENLQAKAGSDITQEINKVDELEKLLKECETGMEKNKASQEAQMQQLTGLAEAAQDQLEAEVARSSRSCARADELQGELDKLHVVAEDRVDELEQLRKAYAQEIQRLHTEEAKLLERVCASAEVEAGLKDSELMLLRAEQAEEAARRARETISQEVEQAKLQSFRAAQDEEIAARKSRSDEFEKMRASASEQALRLELVLETSRAELESEAAASKAKTDEIHVLHAARAEDNEEAQRKAEEAQQLVESLKHKFAIDANEHKRESDELRTQMASVKKRAAQECQAAAQLLQEMQKAKDDNPKYSASVHMIEDWQLTLGIEGKEDEAARGDVSVELAELLSRCGAQQAFRIGRVHLPADFSEASPVCVRMAVKNDGASRWPQTTVIVNMEGESLGMQVKELGMLEPGEVREIEMDLEVQSRTAGHSQKRLYRPRHAMPQLGPRLGSPRYSTGSEGPSSEIRSLWAIVDAATGARLGPLLVFEAMWDLP